MLTERHGRTTPVASFYDFYSNFSKNTYVFSSQVRNALLCMSLLSINCLTAGDTVIPELGAQSVAPMVQERIRQRKKGTFCLCI